MSEPMYPPDYNRTPDIEPKVPMIGAIQAPEELNIYTLFPAWVWQSPSIPQFYWNVYSAEQRIYQICKEIGRLQAYLTYQGQQDNAAHLYLYKHFQKITDELRADLEAEITRAKAAEKLLTDNLNAEIARAQAAEKDIDDRLMAEIERAKAAEKTISDGLAAEIARAGKAEKTLTDDLAAEIARAKKAENANADAIKAETNRAQTAENVNSEKIRQTNKDLEQEATRAREAEQVNATGLADEIKRAQAAEQANAQAIATESTRAGKAETANSQAIQALEPLAKAGEAYSHSHVKGSGRIRVEDVTNSEGGHDYTVSSDYEPAVAKLEQDVTTLSGRADQLKQDIDGVNVGVDQIIAGPGIEIQEAGDKKTGTHVKISSDPVYELKVSPGETTTFSVNGDIATFVIEAPDFSPYKLLAVEPFQVFTMDESINPADGIRTEIHYKTSADPHAIVKFFVPEASKHAYKRLTCNFIQYKDYL